MDEADEIKPAIARGTTIADKYKAEYEMSQAVCMFQIRTPDKVKQIKGSVAQADEGQVQSGTNEVTHKKFAAPRQHR
jgi:hypothetical protein